MRSGVLVVALALAAMTAAAAPPRTPNPRVSLQVKDVTAAEAAAQLSKAAGIPVQVPDHRQGADEANGRLIEKSRFDWTDIPFARALRQLCERYRLRPQQAGGTYRLEPEPAGGPPVNPAPAWERNGLRVAVGRVHLSETRSVAFFPARAESHSGSLYLELRGALPDGDGRAVAAVEKIAAMDDQGTVLIPSSPVAPPDRTSASPTPTRGRRRFSSATPTRRRRSSPGWKGT